MGEICGDCGRTVHKHAGTSSGYRHAPVTKAQPEWERNCSVKPPRDIRDANPVGEGSRGVAKGGSETPRV